MEFFNKTLSYPVYTASQLKKPIFAPIASLYFDVRVMVTDNINNSSQKVTLAIILDENTVPCQIYPEMVIDVDYAAFSFFTMVLPELFRVFKGTQWADSSKLWNGLDGVFAVVFGVLQILDKQSHQRWFTQFSGMINCSSGLQLLLIVGLVSTAVLAHSALAISFTTDSVVSFLLSGYSFLKGAYDYSLYSCWLKDSLAQIAYFETMRATLYQEILLIQQALASCSDKASSVYCSLLQSALNSKQQRLVADFNLQKTVLVTVTKYLSAPATPESEKAAINACISSFNSTPDTSFSKALAQIKGDTLLTETLCEFCVNSLQINTDLKNSKSAIDDSIAQLAQPTEQTLLLDAVTDPLAAEIASTLTVINTAAFSETTYVDQIETERVKAGQWQLFSSSSNALLYGLAAVGMLMAFMPGLQIPAAICIGVACVGFIMKYVAPIVYNYCHPPVESVASSMKASGQLTSAPMNSIGSVVPPPILRCDLISAIPLAIQDARFVI